MKLIYVAAPYSAETKERTESNVEVARNMGALVAEIGASPLMPTVNSAGFGTLSKQDGWEFWMEATSVQLAKCDAMILCQGWHKSVGCGMEVKQAEDSGIPVFYDIQSLENWLFMGDDYEA